MEQTQKPDGSLNPAVQSTDKGSAGTESERELKLLSLRFVGIDPEGRYCFRYPDQPMRLIVGDLSDYQIWQAAQHRHPLIDAETANAAPQIREMGEQFRNYGGVTAEEWLAARGI